MLQPLGQGIDFLGYRIFAQYRRVRPRVVAHCRSKLQQWASQHVRHTAQGIYISANAQVESTIGDALAHLQAMLGSYWGHFAHAQSVRLRHALFARFTWLKALFVLQADGQISPRWVLQGSNFAEQVSALQSEWKDMECLIQKGNRWLWLTQPKVELNESAMQGLRTRFRRQNIGYVCANQTGWLRHGTRLREIQAWFIPVASVGI